MRCRLAKEKDLEQILAIYNYEVEHGTATLDTNPKEMDEWRIWFEMHDENTHPIYVAVTEDIVLGYASLSPYRSKDAFATTVELSLYVDPKVRGRGVASLLMDTILEHASREQGIHSVVSVIEGGNAVSIRIHEKYGFTYCGTLHEVGKKFGRMLDIANYERLFI